MEPKLDISFQGEFVVLLSNRHQTSSLIRVDYLALSKLVFDWADSYDAKVNSSFLPATW